MAQQSACARTTPRELTINICLDHWARYQGTAAQLRAEGLIPDEWRWPANDKPQRWRLRGMAYWLQRKGADYWWLTVTVPTHDAQWHLERDADRKGRAFLEACDLLTEEGQAAAQRRFAARMDLQEDLRYQRFRSALLARVQEQSQSTTEVTK